MRWIYFAILLVLALGTRLYLLDVLPYGHNNDETRMAIDGYVLLQDGVYEPLTYQSRESTFPYLYGALIEVFGFSNGIIRLPSALAGIAGVLCLCLLFFRILPDFWAFCVSLALVTYGPLFALDRLALRTSICTAVVFAVLLLFFVLRSSERRLDWFILGLVFGLGFHTYNAYRVMPLLVVVLLAIHFSEQTERNHLGRKLLFFGSGALLGAANMVYIVLTEEPANYLWREADLLGLAANSEAGFLGMVGHNFAEFFRMLLGQSIPLPVGAEVPYFHFAWVPLFAFGVYVAARARARSPEFALLMALCIFLLPVLLTDEFFARRFLTSLVLVVALTGIGAYEAIRRLGWARNRRVRALVLLLAVGVAVCNLWSYFVGYASTPKWKQGPFWASQRWYGPLVRDHIRPETKIVFADDIEDLWTMTIHLIDIIDARIYSPAVLRSPSDLDEAFLEELEDFCSVDAPVVFLFRIETSSEVIEEVRHRCGLKKIVPLPCPEGIVKYVERRLIMAKRAGGGGGEPDAAQDLVSSDEHEERMSEEETENSEN
jgi:4-amino-4-deoxy-L-arabinose transferase-like glycosyltransferase